MYYPSSENKGADQLRGYREADLRHCFSHMKNRWFSHDVAHMSEARKSEICISQTTHVFQARFQAIPLVIVM